MLVVEVDGLNSVPALPVDVAHAGAKHSLSSIFDQARIDVTVVSSPRVADLQPGRAYRDDELHGLLSTMKQDAIPTDPTVWYVQTLVLTKHADEVLGVLFARKERDRLAVFANEASDNSALLRTVAHEVGHALNLFHSDGDASLECRTATAGSKPDGRSLMNQSRCISPDWNYTFSKKELEHLLHHPEENVRPRTKVSYGCCITTHQEVCR